MLGLDPELGVVSGREDGDPPAQAAGLDDKFHDPRNGSGHGADDGATDVVARR